jgi:hypothetical protein
MLNVLVSCFLILTSALWEHASSAEPAPAREILLDKAHLAAAEIKFQYGQFVVIHRGPIRTPGPADSSVALLSASGDETFNRNPGLDIPNVRTFSFMDAAVTRDQHLIVAAAVWSVEDQVTTVLMLYDALRGQLVRIIRIHPFNCGRIVADARDRVWCLGSDVEKSRAGEDFEIIQRYSLDGQLLGKHFPRSLFAADVSRIPKDLSVIGDMGVPCLLAQGEKVAVWLAAVETLLELDLDGNLLNRSTIPRIATEKEPFYQPALLPGGTMVWLVPSSVSDPDRRNWRNGFYLFDAAGNSWLPVGSSVPTFPIHVNVIGADSSAIVLRSRPEGRIFWLPLPQ